MATLTPTAHASRLLLDRMVGALKGITSVEGRVFEELKESIPPDQVPCILVALDSEEIDTLGMTHDDDGTCATQRRELNVFITALALTPFERDCLRRDIEQAMIVNQSVGWKRRFLEANYDNVQLENSVQAYWACSTRFLVEYITQADRPGELTHPSL